MSVKIRDLMELPVFQEAKIVAGHNGVDKEVKSVTVAEVPDAADWLKGGELVVTTGYFIKDDREFQKKWINALIESGAVALAIKPDRFLGKTPEQLIEIANEKSFCLIELPLDVTWPAVIENVLSTINNYQSQIIKRTEEIHNKLTEIVLKGMGLSHIANTISQLVNNIIIVEDTSLTKLAVSCPNLQSEEAETFLSYRLSQDYVERFTSSQYYVDVCKHSKKSTLNTNLMEYNKELGNITQITMPIVADNTVYGFITLVEIFKKANQVDIVALEHGATTIALEMMKEKIAFETEKRLKRYFLEDLLEGKIDGDLTRNMKYNFINFDMTKPAVAILIYIKNMTELVNLSKWNVYFREKDNKIFNTISQCILEKDPQAFIYEESDKISILYHFSINKEKKQIADEIKKLCQKIINKLKNDFPKIKYNIGIGNIYYQFSNIRKSYDEAKKSIDIGELFIGENGIFFYSELGIYRLLFMVDKKEEIIDFCMDTIGDLFEHDKANNDDLCECLEIYLKNNGNIAKTAKEMFIHPNTLSYRIKKIGSILSKDLNDPKVRFNLYYALMIKKLLLENKRNI